MVGEVGTEDVWMFEWLGQKHQDAFLVEAADRIWDATSLALKSGSGRPNFGLPGRYLQLSCVKGYRP